VSARLKELEKRLKQEPGNLGLRVTLAGALREAGRSNEAVELYRSVALAYRDQNRLQQAVAVCRSILQIAPDDVACQGLLGSLQERLAPRPPTAPPVRPPTVPPEPKRRSSMGGVADPTPLPRAIPYHVADPTSAAQKVSSRDLDLPTTEDAETRPGEVPRPQVSGLAEAARHISGLLGDNVHEIEIDLADALETRKVPKLDTEQMRKISAPPPTIDTPPEPITAIPESDDAIPAPRDTDDDMTSPRDLPHGTKR
jgi:hypothetical protein